VQKPFFGIDVEVSVAHACGLRPCLYARRTLRHPHKKIKTRLDNTMNRVIAVLFTGLLGLFSAVVLAAEPVSKSRFGGVAIGGHDSVAYHNISRAPQDSAVEGRKTYTVKFKGAKWRFLSEESSKLFAANPDKYSPAYNGHCANALSLGEGLIRTNGTHWEIFEDKLYLFYAARGRDRWTDGNWKTYKIDADAAWQRLSR